MKKQIILLIALLLSLYGNAYAVSDTTYPEVTVGIINNHKVAAELATEVKEILLEGNWLEILESNNNTEEGIERVYKFQDIGRLDIITTFANGHAVNKSMVWRISVKMDRVVLTFTDLGSDESIDYEVEKTSDGLTLTDQTLKKKLSWIFQ